MSQSLLSLIDGWRAIAIDDPYGAVEEFANSGGKFWPYAVAYDQIERGLVDSQYVGALALQLARSYAPDVHGLAAFVTLSCKWPALDTTAALNLLGLSHAVSASAHPWLDRLLGRAALQCLKAGLRDSRTIVAEEAANVFGAFGAQHFATANADEIAQLRRWAHDVLIRIDQPDIVSLLEQRIDHVLAGVKERPDGVVGEVGAHSMVREVEAWWPILAPYKHDREPLAALKSHVTALAWRFENPQGGAVQTIYVYSDRDLVANDRGWAIVYPWSSVMRAMLSRAKERKVDVAGTVGVTPLRAELRPMDAMTGSLRVTLEVDTDEDLQEQLTRALRDGPNADSLDSDGVAEGMSDLDDLRDLLRNNKLRVRIAHVGADGASASIVITPTDSPATVLFRSRKLKTKEIPQANELDRIFSLVDCIAREEAPTPEAINVTTARQVQYYKAAARILELVVGGSSVQLTRVGWLLHKAAGEDRYRRLRAAFEACPCGQAWIEWADATKLSDVPPKSAEAFLSARSELTGDTISRRANTLNVWLEILRNY